MAEILVLLKIIKIIENDFTNEIKLRFIALKGLWII